MPTMMMTTRPARFGGHKFVPEEYVSINGGQALRVVAVDPVVLSMALIKSFALAVAM